MGLSNLAASFERAAQEERASDERKAREERNKEMFESFRRHFNDDIERMKSAEGTQAIADMKALRKAFD